MKLQQTIIEKNFHIKAGNKIYYVNYLNSDGQTLGLLNRLTWEVYDAEGDEITFDYLKGMDKKEKKQINKNYKLVNKLIAFCLKHFNEYNPKV